MSDDGRHALAIIAFVGSVFSPYYARARRRGGGDPHAHCALNVALYGARGRRWAMTERGAGALARDANALVIGPSSLAWDGSALTIAIDEVTAPWPSRLRGTVRVTPAALPPDVVALDGAGAHRWQPVAPCARVDVALSHPDTTWSGPGYVDRNAGDAPLEHAFTHWHWSRAPVAGGTVVLYDAWRRDGAHTSVALRCDDGGDVRAIAPPPPSALPRSGWRVARAARSEAGHAPAILRTLEDAPFYARTLVRTRVLGEDVVAVHESLSLDRFRSPWVQALLPFRMPRRPGGRTVA